MSERRSGQIGHLAHLWFSRLPGALLAALIIIGPQSNAHGSASQLRPMAAIYQAEIVSNSQFVFGPSARSFNLSAYLAASNSPLLPDAPLIEWWCAYASVNAQVVLTLLEVDGRVAHGLPSSLPPEAREIMVESLVMRLADRFYWHLYEHGERSARPSSVPLRIELADGSSLELNPVSSGTYAALESLAESSSMEDFARLTDAHDPASFVATWARLFPGSNPLDGSIPITPTALPPAELFQFPFPAGQTWWFNGAHNWHGSGVTYGKPYSSMDFFTLASSCSSPPPGDWAVAAATGTGYRPGEYGCWYRVDHIGGWTTSYYHLRNTAQNGPVSANGKIGTIACETCAGGFATSPHVHFSLLYNGAYMDLDGVELSGWMVDTGNGDYQSGGLEREGVFLAPYSSVLNQGLPGPTPAPTRTVTPTATLTATPTPSPVATPSATPAGATARYLYPASNGLVRICPVKLVAEATDPRVETVRFWAKLGATRQEVGEDSDGADGWQTDWDCQDAADGAAVLTLSVEDGRGQEVVTDGGTTPVTIRKDCPDATYRTAFFSNTLLDGAPASSWCKASGIAYAWGTGSPGAGVAGSDNFSARFRGRFAFDSGTYRFTGNSDDGIRVWVDRSLIVDQWRSPVLGSEAFQFTRRMGAGAHEIRVDYYEESDSASVALRWEKTTAARFYSFLPLVRIQ